jgi:hypothetical protein
MTLKLAHGVVVHLLLLLLVVACESSKKASPPVADAAATAVLEPPRGTISIIASKPPPVDASVVADAGAAAATFDCDSLTGEPRGGKSVGHTSVVFKIELASGKKVAFKPHAKKVRDRYRGEIAAYRFAEVLGIPNNVPPACFRSFDANAVASAVSANDAGASLFANEVIVDGGGKTKGVVIPWIEGLGFWAIEKDPLRAETRDWLTAKKPIPEDKVDLARQLSTMIAFDTMTANWDRFSGGNVGLDKTGAIVLFIDNDSAFMELSPPKDWVAKNKQLLDATDRFSKSFVAQVRTLDEEKIATALGEEAAGKPLLSRTVIAAVAKRAKELLAVIDAKIASHGETETLYFR